MKFSSCCFIPQYLAILCLFRLCSQELLIYAFSTSSKTSPTTTRATTTPSSLTTANTDNEIIVRWEEELLGIAKPLSPAPPSLHESLEILKRDGVVRLNRDAFSIDETICGFLRDRILFEIESPSNKNFGGQTKSDKNYIDSYVPGTRLRPGKGAMDITFGGDLRHDMLLPLRDDNFPQVLPVLESAASQLEPLLLMATDQLLPRLHGIPDMSPSSNENDSTLAAELVEVGSLLVRRGSFHQSVHGDYRRYTEDKQNGSQEEPLNITQAREGKVPPRIVTFVALQDIPSDQHGPTGFITGTHNSQAHGLQYRESTTIHEKNGLAKSRKRILESSTSGVRTTRGFRRGDMLIYDASVLHWGGANSIPENDRAIFYFGVSKLGSAARLDVGPKLKGYETIPPILLQDITGMSQQH